MAEEKEYKATIYDDVWRTLVHDFPQLLVSFVNELFAESYGKDARVEFLQDVHEQNQPDGSIEKRTTDTYFRIVDEHGNSRKYHIECQSSADSSMLVRIFEYGAQIALDDAEKSESKIVLELPHAAVLFLRSTAKTPDKMEIEIKTPGGSISYGIPVAKMKSYTIDMMLKKRLLILLPFYMFIVENSLKECEANEVKRQELMESLRTIATGLDNLLLLGDIDFYTRKSLMELMDKVNYHLARNYAKVQKEAEKVMGGRVLEYEAKTIYKNGVAAGVEQGRSQGISQGISQERNNMIIGMLKKKLSIEDIAEIARTTVDQVVTIGKKAALL